MSLASALAIANSGLSNITAQLAVVSQNVSNANTSGYTEEVGQQTAASAGNLELGVRTGVTTRSIDTALQTESRQQNAQVAALTVTANALAQIDNAEGTPGAGTDLASLAQGLQAAFTTLAATPSSQAAQLGVVTAAKTLASGINTLGQAISSARQTANDTAATDTATLNTALASIGTLSKEIAALARQHTSTAGLEDQRDQAMNTVANLTGAHFATMADGSVQVILPSGLTLPTDGSADFAVASATLSPTATAPPLTLNGKDVTGLVTGGSLGAELVLRDTTLPTFQAQLDEFAHDLAGRFSAAGLELFTDNGNPVAAAASSGPVQAGYVGLANRIAVNPAVVANPTLVQAGTAGSSSGASDQTVINAVLNQAYGPAGASTAPPASAQGLGLSGTLAAGFAIPGTLLGFASTLVAAQSGASSTAQAALSSAQAVQTTLNSKLASVSGVSVDSEMSTMIGLQNAYGANARVLTAVQQMWTDLLNIGT